MNAKLASEYGHSDINDQIPQIRPKKCMEISAIIRVRVTTGPHGGNLNKWLNGYFQRNRVIIYFSGLTRQLTCDLWLDIRCGDFDYPADDIFVLPANTIH